MQYEYEKNREINSKGGEYICRLFSKLCLWHVAGMMSYGSTAILCNSGDESSHHPFDVSNK